jgi:hypothetical protein
MNISRPRACIRAVRLPRQGRGFFVPAGRDTFAARRTGIILLRKMYLHRRADEVDRMLHRPVEMR